MPGLKVGLSLAAVAGVALACVGWYSFKSTQGSVEAQKLLDLGLNTLDQQISMEQLGFYIEVHTSNPQSLLGYVGIVAVRPKAGAATDTAYYAEFRPPREQLDVVPYTTKIFDGLVTKQASAHGDYASFAASLGVDEAAEALIESTLAIQYKDNADIPWDKLRRLKLDPANDYYFVDSVVLVQTSVKKYRKTKGSDSLKGLGFSSGGEFYVASSDFEMKDRLALRVWDLRHLLPAEGNATSSTISEILAKPAIETNDANKLSEALRSRTDAAHLRGAPSFNPERALPSIEGAVKPLTFRIPGVPLLRQQWQNDCWATVGAILNSWKQGKLVAPEQFVQSLGPEWVAVYRNDRGLTIDRKRAFLHAAHLRSEAGQSYQAEAIVDLLQSNGPLWFTVSSGKGFSTHATVVTGIRRASSGRELVTYIDPAVGHEVEEYYWDFADRYEQFAYDMNRVYDRELDSGELDYFEVVHF